MASVWMLLVAVVIILVTLYFLLLTYRLTFHPLAKIPGPLINKLTGWPNLSAVLTGRRHIIMHQLHQRYGYCYLRLQAPVTNTMLRTNRPLCS